MENMPLTSHEATQDLVITRVLNAPRERVFQVWTEPKHVQNWWGPKDFSVPVCKIDLRPAGTFHYCMRSPQNKDYWNKGIFREVRAPEKVVCTIYFSDEKGNFVAPSKYGMGPDFPAESLMTITFSEVEGKKTKLRLHYSMPLSVAKRYLTDVGWNQSLDRFAAEVEKM